MGKALLVVIGIALLVFATFDIRATPASQVQFLPKPAWYFVVLLPYIGPLLWLWFGRSRQTNGPTRPAPRGPDDDPDFLRGL